MPDQTPSPVSGSTNDDKEGRDVAAVDVSASPVSDDERQSGYAYGRLVMAQGAMTEERWRDALDHARAAAVHLSLLCENDDAAQKRDEYERLGRDFSSAKRMNVRQVAKAFGVHENTIRKWADTGVLPCERMPTSGFRRFHPDDVDRLLRETRP